MNHHQHQPAAYLILTNISKRRNVQNLLQIAVAFGCPIVFVVGIKKFNFEVDGVIPSGTDNSDNMKFEDDNEEVFCSDENGLNEKAGEGNNFSEIISESIQDSPENELNEEDDESRAELENGEGGAINKTDIPVPIQPLIKSGRLKIMKFEGLEECRNYIKSMPSHCNCSDANYDETTASGEIKASTQIIGVEITSTSQNLEEEPFIPPSSTHCKFCRPSVAFMMGNEGSGMTNNQMAICDSFVRISQYGGGTASLNVSVAAGVVFHRYFHWARGEGQRKG